MSIMDIVVGIILSIIVFSIIIGTCLFMLSSMKDTMSINNINCTELNGTLMTKECYCNNFYILISFNWSNFDCGCPEISGEYCIFSNGTQHKYITKALS